MPYRLSKITTRKGDDGKTTLGTPERISKSANRIEVLGTLDELNSAIGLVLAFGLTEGDIQFALNQIQQDLFNAGSELCPPYKTVIHAEEITRLDQWIETWNPTLPPLKEFLLPGGTPASATCHLARTICRRAERSLVKLHEAEKINLDLLRYINRLSDVLFIIARVIAREAHTEEVVWQHQK